MIRLSQVAGQRVLAREGAAEIGSVRRLLVDGPDGRVVAAELEGVVGEATILEWERVSSVGRDALIVDAPDVARGPVSDLEQRFAAGQLDLVGKQVLDETGTALGPLEDIEFDARSGRLSAVLVPGHSLPLERLVAVGPDAIIVPLPDGAPSTSADQPPAPASADPTSCGAEKPATSRRRPRRSGSSSRADRAAGSKPSQDGC